MTTDTRRLEPHELKDAMRPGLFPDLDNAPDTVAEWDGLDDLREQHQHALDRYQRGLDPTVPRAGREPNPAECQRAPRS